jgi:hypothetical protein
MCANVVSRGTPMSPITWQPASQPAQRYACVRRISDVTAPRIPPTMGGGQAIHHTKSSYHRCCVAARQGSRPGRRLEAAEQQSWVAQRRPCLSPITCHPNVLTHLVHGCSQLARVCCDERRRLGFFGNVTCDADHFPGHRRSACPTRGRDSRLDSCA